VVVQKVKGAGKKVKRQLKRLSPKELKKTVTAKNMKSYGKVATSTTVAALGYAAVQEIARGSTRALIPKYSADLEWRWSNTEVGLAGQTILFITASNIAAKVLNDINVLSKTEAKIAGTAGMGLAVGRALMGTSILDIGKRFEYLMDGEAGAALFPGRGPAITTPANASAAAEIVSSNATRDSFTVENGYLQNRVSRGMPYTPNGANAEYTTRNTRKFPGEIKPFTAPDYI